MQRRSIAEYTKAEFDVLRNRLENARDALRSSGCLLQSVARAYYIVYATASFGAGRHGVKARHFRGREQVVDQDFSHNELPDVIYALYTGGKRANIDDPGSGPGIGSGTTPNAKPGCMPIHCIACAFGRTTDRPRPWSPTPPPRQTLC